MNKLLQNILLLIILSSILISCRHKYIHHWEIISPGNDKWKILISDTIPDRNWTELNYDDSKWTKGLNNVDKNISIKNKTAYVRIKFNIKDTSKIGELVLRINFVAGLKAFINGKEVAKRDVDVIINKMYRENEKPSEIPVKASWDSHTFFINKERLSEVIDSGENILAIHILNDNFFQVDISKTILAAGIIDNTKFSEAKAYFNNRHKFGSSNLPLIILNTNGKVIKDKDRTLVHMGIIHNGEGKRNGLRDPFNEYNGYINIETRGQTSQMFSKKSYDFETQDSAGNNLNISLLGLPVENDWILYGPFIDKSLLRNVLIFKISNDIGRYATRTEFCELVINDNYRGVYVLMEKIKRDTNRVNISRLTKNDTTGDNLTGGYIIRLDKNEKDFWVSPFSKDNSGIPAKISYYYPRSRDIREVQKQYIKNYVTDFEEALYNSGNYEDYIDVGSFIDYFILNELSRNVDAYRISTFLYKDRDSQGGRLTIGPLWDLNLSFGNAAPHEGYKPDGWVYTKTKEVPFWWEKLLEDETFRNKLRARWDTLRRGPLKEKDILKYIDKQTDLLDEAHERNFRVWKILGPNSELWANYFFGEDYKEEIEYMRDWIKKRLKWMDENMPGK